MRIELTNKNNIHISMLLWLYKDNYNNPPINDKPHYSATKLISPPRATLLQQRVEVVTKDVTDFVHSRLGSCIHESIENVWVKHYKDILPILGYTDEEINSIRINPDTVSEDIYPIYLEKRFYKEFDDFVINGQVDMIFGGELYDIKSTSTFVYGREDVIKKYVLQGSIYRYLAPDIITGNKIHINFVFKDWKEDKYLLDPENYPPSPIHTASYDLLSLEDTEKFILERVALLHEYKHVPEVALMRCTDEELWKKPPSYKYYKKADAVRATKVFDNYSEALSYQSSSGGVGIIKIVEDPPKACKYCLVKEHCSQKKEYYG